MADDLVVVVAVLVAGGFLPAFAVCRRAAPSLAFAPLAFGLLAWVAAMISLTLRQSLGDWLIAVFVTADAAALWWLWTTRRVHLRTLWGDPFERAAGLVAVAASAVPALALRRAPVDWDARSIWTFHADWLWSGGERAVQAASSPLFQWSHPDYPIFVPSTVAAAWRALGEPKAEVAQATIGVVAIAAVALTIIGLARVVTRTPGRTLSDGALLLGLAALTFSFYGLGGRWAFNGYVDFTWAAILGAGAVYSLLTPDDRTLPGALLLAAAVGTKNEAMVAGLAVAAVAAVRHRRRPRHAAVFAIPFAGAFAWNLVYRTFDVPSPSALDRAPDWLTSKRIRLTVESVWGETWPTLLALAVAALVGGFALRRQRRDLGLPDSLWLWVPSLISLASISLPLVWTANLSRVRPVAERVTVGAELLLLIDVFLTGVTAATVLAATRHDRADNEGKALVDSDAIDVIPVGSPRFDSS